MGITMNGPSGIDTASLIDQLVALEQQKVTKVENQKSAYQVKIDAYSKLQGYLSDLRTKAKSLADSAGFNLYTAKSSEESIVSLTGSTGATEGQYGIGVYQAASMEKLISADGKVTSQSAALSSFGIGTGTISLNGTNIDISATDTIQDLRMKINTATDSTGNSLGVTATVMKIADNNFRLVLSAKTSGSAGAVYKDVSGSTLKDLGVIASTGGDKGNIAQVLSSGTPLPALNAGDIIQYSGFDHNGNKVTGGITVTSSDPAALLKNIKDAFHGMVDASIDAGGNLVLTDKVNGSSQLQLSSLTVGGSALAMSTSTIGQNGAGVLSNGKDAYFSVDNINLVSASNTATGFIQGVTINIKKAAADTVADASITRDTAGIEKKVTDLLDSYNALRDFASKETKLGDPNDKNSKSGDLAGDMTVSRLIDQVQTAFHASFNQFGWDLNSLTSIGVNTDKTTGHLSLDTTKFEKGLNTDFEGVTRLFTITGYSPNNSVTYGRSTKDTGSGNYLVKEADADHLAIQVSGDSTWYTSDGRTGDIASFSSGPAKGLILNVPAGSTGGLTVNFAFSKGIGSMLDDMVAKLTDSTNGMIALQQKSFTTSIRNTEDRITKVQTSVDSYRTRLVNQFASMEKMIANIKAQSSNMMAQLGMSNSSSN